MIVRINRGRPANLASEQRGAVELGTPSTRALLRCSLYCRTSSLRRMNSVLGTSDATTRVPESAPRNNRCLEYRAVINQILLYAGATLPLIWAVAHLFPTQNVVAGFGAISVDNKRIITMEWINEAAALMFIAAVVFAVTWIDHTSTISTTVYWLSIVALNALSVISLLTAFKINFLPYKLCPVFFTTSSVLILLGMLL